VSCLTGVGSTRGGETGVVVRAEEATGGGIEPLDARNVLSA
jgi:hypothetical protein